MATGRTTNIQPTNQAPVGNLFMGGSGQTYANADIAPASDKFLSTDIRQGAINPNPTIPVANLTTPTNPLVTAPAPTTNYGGLPAATAGIVEAAKNVPVNPLDQQKSTLDQTLQEILNTQGTNPNAGVDFSGVDTAKKLSDQYLSQLEAEQLANRRQQEEFRKAGGGTTAGMQVGLEKLNRDSLAKQADLAILQTAANRDYATASSIADRQVQMNLEEKNNKLDALKYFYENNKADFNKAEDRAYQEKIKAQDAALKKQTEIEIYRAKNRIDNAFSGNVPGLPGDPNYLPTAPLTYDIKAGEDPYNIAKDRGFTMQELQDANLQIKDWKNIQPGTTLKLPQAKDVSNQLVNSDGTYNTTIQNNMLSRMSPQDAALVQQIGEYKMDIAKVTSLRSDQRQRLAEKVALVYPNFEMSNYAANAAYRKSLASTTPSSAGSIINSANKMINHLTTFADAVMSTHPSTLASIFNVVRNATEAPFSQKLQEELGTARTSALGVTEELAKFFKGTGTGDAHTIEEWNKRINPNATAADLKGTVQGAIDLMQGQLVPMIDQYKRTLGKEPPADLFLNQTTVQNLSRLKNEGYKIDIPGVYYTDKTAWQKYGGGTQSDWDNAINTLTQAGLPLTTENILQASQLNY